MEKDFAVYVLVRNDLPSMNPGKAMAQVHHAGVQMMVFGQRYNSTLIKEYINRGAEQGSDFNTTIVLSASLAQVNTLINFARDNMIGIPCGTVLDPSYPFFVDPELAPFVEKDPQVKRIGQSGNKVLFVRPEITCGWILMDRNDMAMRSLVEAMPLHP